MSIPIFLELHDILEIHSILIRTYGGTDGIRDKGLLLSAIEMPQAGFGGEFYHKTLFEMAAAYLFHIVKNHPFIDGNKRIGFACADTFLKVNGLVTEITSEDVYDLVLNIASSNEKAKEDIVAYFEKNYNLLK